MLRLNGLASNGTIVCEEASVAAIASWVEERGQVDVIDLDVQGAEFSLLPPLIELLDARVARVIVGTHESEGHHRLFELFLAHNWTLLSHFPFRGESPCTNALRGDERMRWTEQEGLLEKCYAEFTAHGPVIPWDGELVFDNPRLRRP